MTNKTLFFPHTDYSVGRCNLFETYLQSDLVEPVKWRTVL